MIERVRHRIGVLHSRSLSRQAWIGLGFGLGDTGMAVAVELFDDLDAAARDAGAALDRTAQPALQDRIDWFRLTAAHCPLPGPLLIARAREGEASAWLFLVRDGRSATALASWYTLAFAPIFSPGSTESEQLAMLTAIARALLQRLDHIALEPLLTTDPTNAAFRAAGWRTCRTKRSVNWTVATANGFDAYWAARPGRLRSTMKRKARAGGFEIAILDRFDADAWAEYETVYRSSWKPEEGSPPFLRALAEQEGAAGTLRLGLLRKAGRPIAAQLWLVENGVATIHKLAHVRDADGLSPGTVLSEAMFRRVIAQDGATTVDFGTGNDPYKADWMDSHRPLYRLDGYNPRSLRGYLGWARSCASALVRRATEG
jgi:CelD/BcsL family acetyltransferase involved in cellulose biosynthesis